MAFDSAMSQVAATMGNVDDMCEEDFDKLKASAREMGVAFDETTTATELAGKVLREFAQEQGASTAFSASQAAEALNYMALAGYSVERSMEALPNVLNLAAAGGIELATASDMVTDAQSALGLTMEESAILVDQMAKASSKSNTSVAQLGEAILTVGGTASYMAGGTEELNKVLGVLADNGIKGSEAGTHLRNMLLSLSSPTTDAQNMLNKLGVTVFSTEGNMRSFADIFPELNSAMADMTDQQKLDAFSTIFNSRDIASATALLGTTTERWEELGDAILDSAGAAEQMAATQLNNLAGDITLFKSALEGAQIVLSDQLTPSLRGFVQFGTTAINTLTMAFQEGGLSGAMDALGTILSDGLNMVISQLPSMIDAGMQLLSALGQGLMDNLPVILDAAIEIVMMLINGVAGALPDIAAAALEIIVSLANGISQSLPTLIPTVTDVVLQIVDTLVDNIPMLIDAGVQLITGLATGQANAIPMVIERIPEIIDGLISGLLEAIPQLISAGVQLLTAVVQNLPAIISGIVNALPSIIRGIVKGFTGAIPQLVKAGVDLFVALVKNLPEIISGIVEALPEIINAILEGLSELDSMLGELFVAAWEGVKEVFAPVGEFFSGIWSSITDAFSSVGGWFSDKFTEANNKVQAAWSAVGSWASNRWNDIKGAFSSVGNWFKEKFTEANENTQAAWSEVGSWASDRWDDITNAFSEAGNWFNKKFTEANENVQAAWSAVGSWAADRWNDIRNAFSSVGNWFKEKFTEANENTQAAWSEVGSWASDRWSDIKGAFSSVGGWFSDTFAKANENAKNPWAAVGNWFTDRWGDIKEAFPEVADWFSEKFSDAKEKVVSAWDNIKSNFSTIWENIKSGFNISDALTWGKDVIKNFIDGIKQKWNDLKNTVKGTAQIIKDFIGFSEPKEGPLSNFHTYAPDMMKLFAEGIRDNAILVQRQLDKSLDFDFGTMTMDLEASEVAFASENTHSSYGPQNGFGGLSGSSFNLVQNIYSEAKTAADLMEESMYQAKKAVLLGV